MWSCKAGTDVARKVVILARECNLKVELQDVEVQSLVPEPLRESPSAEAFLEGLPQARLHHSLCCLLWNLAAQRCCQCTCSRGLCPALLASVRVSLQGELQVTLAVLRLRSLTMTWQPELRRLSQLGRSWCMWAMWMLPLASAQWASR